MGSAWLWLFFRASAAQAEKDGEFRKTKNAFKATLSGAGWIQIVYESINDRTSFMESHSGGITSGKPDVFRKGNDFVFLGDVNYALYYQDNRPENTTGYATLKRIADQGRMKDSTRLKRPMPVADLSIGKGRMADLEAP
jgi:hypothetical protein